MVLSCAESNAPARPIPASLEIVTNTSSSATAGAAAGNFTVRARDARGNPVSGVLVTFSVSLGGGRVSPVGDTTGADGSATTVFTVGTVPGENQVTATVSGLAPVVSAVVSGAAGPIVRIALNPRVLRIPAGRTTEPVGAVARDSLGNATGSAVTWTSRNPGLINVAPPTGGSVSLQVVSRPGQAYVVASAAGVSDSILVSVLDATSTACAFEASPNVLGVGESLSFDSTGVVCVRSQDAGAEYAIISHYGAAAGTAFATVEVMPRGVVPPSPIPEAAVVGETEHGAPNTAFESALRERERREIGSHVAAARSWLATRPPALTATLKEGDLAPVNVNAFGFCANPEMRSARVAAITERAVILADLENPPGGFTDAEYRAFGITMDTLVHPLDTEVFGEPSDIDGRTPRGSNSGIVLGFFYSRDLLPKQGATTICPGSNVGEMFYVVVPDTGGVLSDRRSKDFVANVVVGTIAHEYQHLISASRRLYVTRTSSPIEELWLNEGLSHIAEELLFYRVSKLAPRQNLGAAALYVGSAVRDAFELYGRSNVARYSQYLRSPELNSPISTEDFIATRGAAWSFLRYVADQQGPTDSDLWHRIVNGQTTGMDNLDHALAGSGFTTLGLLRDWSASVFADDYVPEAKMAFQQLSWDFVSGMPAVGLAFPLAPVTLINGLLTATPLRAGGSSYMRFGVGQSQEALLRVTGASGRALPAGVRLTVVRTR
jgi:Big-like domain-containing protein